MKQNNDQNTEVIRTIVKEELEASVGEVVKRTVEDSMAVFIEQISVGKTETVRTPGLKDSQMCGWFLNETNELFRGFDIKPEDTVVDIGCGEGSHLNFCAKRGAALICIDQDEKALNEAMQKLESSQARSVTGHVSDGNPLPLADGVASRVICNEVLEHVDDPEQFIKEVVRIGAADAKFLIGVPDPASEKVFQEVAWPGYFQKPNHVRIFERNQFDDFIKDAGLVIEDKQYYGFYWTMWWALFWGLDPDNDGGNEALLKSWANTWHLLLKGDGGKKVKDALDNLAPKSQIVVAHKA